MAGKGRSTVREDPTPLYRYDWPAIAAEAKADAGNWRKVFDDDSRGLAVAIMQGRNAALKRDNGFEVTTRHNDKIAGTCSLYVKYDPAEDRSK